MPDVEHPQKSRKRPLNAAKDEKGPPLLKDQPKAVQLILQGLMGLLTVEEVAEIERQFNSGGVVDLVGANASKVVGTMIRQLGRTWKPCGKGRGKVQGQLPRP